jgi:hypothetical protein
VISKIPIVTPPPWNTFRVLILGEVLVLALSTLEIVYIIDHEVVPRPCKISVWLLNSSRDHFHLHQGKNVTVTMEFEVPKRHILIPTPSTNMVQWESPWQRQKRCSSRKRPMAKKCYYNIILMIFLGEEKIKTREDKRMVKLYIFLSFIPTFFGHILKKTQHIHFLMHGHSSWSTFGLHLVRTLKNFVNWFLFETGPWMLDHKTDYGTKTIFHGPTSWSTV